MEAHFSGIGQQHRSVHRDPFSWVYFGQVSIYYNLPKYLLTKYYETQINIISKSITTFYVNSLVFCVLFART